MILSYADTPGKVSKATFDRRLLSTILSTRWDSLPSLDINGTDPDIVYSVELYQITCGQDIFVGQETVLGNNTNNTVDPMEIYRIVIAARNNVEGARNGESVVIKGI